MNVTFKTIKLHILFFANPTLGINSNCYVRLIIFLSAEIQGTLQKIFINEKCTHLLISRNKSVCVFINKTMVGCKLVVKTF